MNNTARRIHVSIGDNYREYQPTDIHGVRLIGTVKTGRAPIGALGLHIQSGLYYQFNMGKHKHLKQYKVIAAIEAAKERI